MVARAQVEYADLEALLDQKHQELMGRFEELFGHLMRSADESEMGPRSAGLQPLVEPEATKHAVAAAVTADITLQAGTVSEVAAPTDIDRSSSYEIAKEQLSLPQDHLMALEPVLEKAASMPLSVEAIEDPSTASRFRSCVKSWRFESFFAGVLVSNAIFLGVQTQWTSQHLQEDLPGVFLTLQMIYAVLFILEILLRLAAWGPLGFFCATDWAWHLLDILVSATAVLDLAAVVAGIEAKPSSSSSGFRLLRIMKIARLARAIRMVKVLRFIRALRVLVFSILYTLRSLVWSLVLLLVIIYAFSILFSDATIDHALENNLVGTDDDHPIMAHFGSPVRSMNTLFRSISGGVTWEGPADALSGIGWEWSLIFTLYVAFCCFAVLNVMVGVFCHSAITGAEKDQDLLVQSLLQEKESFRERLLQLFRSFDDDGNGIITLLEFESRFEDESVRALFEALELGAADAWTLFQMLDTDGNNYIHADEFIDSCIRMRGSARSVDLCGLRLQTSKIRSQLSDLTRAAEQMRAAVLELAKGHQVRLVI
ncbi:CAC [Symbiodinium necroappetens]|uniref:CAC protein n=1 Tax=Symbiodinium necroappetens TaxID=1628268 RepID=A0A812U8D7_9DINO|nr:CAC [Symbiodinium necroappetens]